MQVIKIGKDFFTPEGEKLQASDIRQGIIPPGNSGIFQAVDHHKKKWVIVGFAGFFIATEGNLEEMMKLSPPEGILEGDLIQWGI